MKTTVKITREEAIEALARNEISSVEIREDILERLHSLFTTDEERLKCSYIWDQDREELVLNSEVNPVYEKIMSGGFSDEFREGDFTKTSNPKYDEVLVEWEKDSFKLWNNEELSLGLAKVGINVDQIIGEMKLFACPCCGADTLPERHGWDICPVCWHEDSGFDNINSSYSYVGDNIGLHLYVQRINFLMHGISCPDRKDLIAIKEPIENYTRSRFFEIDTDKNLIFEKNSDWSAPLTPPSVQEHISRITKLPAMQLALIISESILYKHFDYSSLFPDLQKKKEAENFSPSEEEIDRLKRSVFKTSYMKELLQNRFEEALGLKF